MGNAGFLSGSAKRAKKPKFEEGIIESCGDAQKDLRSLLLDAAKIFCHWGCSQGMTHYRLVWASSFLPFSEEDGDYESHEHEFRVEERVVDFRGCPDDFVRFLVKARLGAIGFPVLVEYQRNLSGRFFYRTISWGD